jgi:multidrug resistance efflux pump
MITFVEAWNSTVQGLGWALWGLSRPPVFVGRRIRRLATSFRFWVLVVLGLVVLLVAYYALADRYTPFTTDAYVQAYVVQVAPQVGEKVVRVHVREGDRVKAGALLFELDPALFERKVASQEAKLVEAEHEVKQLEAKLVLAEHQVKQLDAELATARADHERLVADAEYAASVHRQEQAIFKTDSTTERRYLETVQKNKASQAAVRQAAGAVRRIEEALNARIAGEHALVAQVKARIAGEQALVAQMKAQLAEARLNLSYTRVQAPCAGLVTDLQLREGAYAHTGQAVMTLIDTGRWLVVANFRENSLARLREGQPARVALRGVPGQLFNARVVSVGWGVSQGQGVPSGQLPDVKVPTSWVPPAQRFQVRLILDDPESVPLRVGMTGSVAVYPEPEGLLNDVTEFWHQVIAWLYYL